MQNIKDLLIELGHHTSLMNSKVIHDFNNPLTVVIGQLSIMSILLEKEELDKDRLKSILKKIGSSTDQLQERTNDFRSYYKLLAKSSDIKNVEQIVRSTVFYFASLDISVNATTEKNFSTNCPPSLLIQVLKACVLSVAETRKKSAINFKIGSVSAKKEITVNITQPEMDLFAQELLAQLCETACIKIDYQPGSTALILDN